VYWWLGFLWYGGGVNIPLEHNQCVLNSFSQQGVMSMSGMEQVHRPVRCRGVRGATVAESNTEAAILAATRELLYTVVKVNGIREEEVASIFFTTTRDLNACYPATAARQLGWYRAALICGHEMDVPDGLPQCVRILLHWNTEKSINEIQHVYLSEAQSLRPDRETIPPIPEDERQAVLNLTGDVSLPAGPTKGVIR
jgi:chorismate mutase